MSVSRPFPAHWLEPDRFLPGGAVGVWWTRKNKKKRANCSNRTITPACSPRNTEPIAWRAESLGNLKKKFHSGARGADQNSPELLPLRKLNLAAGGFWPLGLPNDLELRSPFFRFQLCFAGDCGLRDMKFSQTLHFSDP